ncbi:hypothetical protein Hanom_Chr04g00380311 [Helianthus anomalus]
MAFKCHDHFLCPFTRNRNQDACEIYSKESGEFGSRSYDKDASKFSRRKTLTNFEPGSCDGKLSPGTENEGRRQLTSILVFLIKAFS